MMTRRNWLLGASLAATLNARPMLSLGDPVLVAESPPDEHRWGRYQFPVIERFDDGGIAVSFSVLPDAAESYGAQPPLPNRAISRDGGLTWRMDTTSSGVSGLRLPNGDRLKPLTPKPFPLAQLNLPKPAGIHVGSYGKEQCELYRLRDLPEALRRIWFLRWTKSADKWIEEQDRLNDPLALRYSIRALFPIVWWGDIRVVTDGSLIAGVYPGYLEGQPGFPCNVFFYRSTDQGKSWDIQGRILYQPDPNADPKARLRDGFTEPAFTILRDGSFLCVMRTSDGNGVGPMYLSRSRDLGKHWSRPVAFAPTGVDPQLLLLGNGTLVLSSGRPGVDVRVSSDGGKTWTDPYHLVPLTSENVQADSCGYTSLLALDDNSLLIAYSSFKHLGRDGKLHKAILVRPMNVKK
ncbi:MAG TPA: sialidase family protein [Bryobacteraceae bacterium]|nr:sialidase family protein [Bryobacteraceae bacterium]